MPIRNRQNERLGASQIAKSSSSDSKLQTDRRYDGLVPAALSAIQKSNDTFFSAHGKARLVPVTAPIWLGPEKTEKPPLVVGSSLADGKSGALHKATCTSDLHCRLR